MRKNFIIFILLFLLNFLFYLGNKTYGQEVQGCPTDEGYTCFDNRSACPVGFEPPPVEKRGCGKLENQIDPMSGAVIGSYYTGVCCKKKIPPKIEEKDKKCPPNYECLKYCPDDYLAPARKELKSCGSFIPISDFGNPTNEGIYDGVCCKKKTEEDNENNKNEFDSLIKVPGITCGNAEAKDESRFCCVQEEFDVRAYADSIIPDFGCFLGWCVSNIPKGVVGAVISLPLFQRIYNIQPKQESECVNGKAEYSDLEGCVCKPNKTDSSVLCERYLINKKEEYDECKKCAGKGIWTALGCLETRPEKFILNNVFKTGLGLAGGFALLCIIYAAFILQTSAGNPEKIKKAQELLTSCIMGLVLIIFSVFLLKLIGVDILKIPGFGK